MNVTAHLPGAALSAGRQGIAGASFAPYRRLGKRLLDAFAAALGLLVASPLLVVCAIAVRLGSRGPVLFRQGRVGRGGVLFHILKFRTMVPSAEKNGLRITADGDPRITPIGRWLRRTKLDELPQLLNVLKGDMSLVGPRPEVPEYVAAYSPDQKMVLAERPGITGPASLAYIDEEKVLAVRPDPQAYYVAVLMPRKLALDLAYCANVNFLTDVRLILATLKRMCGRPRKGSPAPAIG